MPPNAPLEYLCALTCGASAGAGAILNVLKPDPEHTVAVFGVGTVGLTAIAAARLRGSRRIIAIDRHQPRLDLARELGATDVIEARDDVDMVEQIMRVAPRGVDRSFDSTGVKDVMLAAIYSLAPHGVFGYVSGTGGVPLDLDLNRILTRGVSIRGIMGGEGTGGLFHRELVDLFERGHLPVDRLVKTYPFDAINEALTDMRTGATIKPVLTFTD